jgi:hypothetical protein
MGNGKLKRNNLLNSIFARFVREREDDPFESFC